MFGLDSGCLELNIKLILIEFELRKFNLNSTQILKIFAQTCPIIELGYVNSSSCTSSF